MLPARIDHAFQREKIIAESMHNVATDLRLIDLADLVAYLRTMQIASAGMLVQSSAELWFKRDTLQFGQSGDVQLNWDTRPQITFDMEFHNMSVHAYFRLVLEAKLAGVEITYISFDEAADDPEINTCRLADALLEARVNKNEDVGTSVF